MTEASQNIFQRMLGVMKDVKYIQKGEARVNNQYRFVSHDSVVAALHGPLVKHGIMVIPSIQEMTQQDNRTMVKLAVGFVNVDSPSDQIAVMSCGYGIDNGDKGIGKAVSYAYKYALLKTFCLETGDDPDQDAGATYEPPKCLEFDSTFKECDVDDMLRFLQASTSNTGKHLEDMKREAVARSADFIVAYEKWKKKGKK